MSIKSELQAIDLELKSIEESKDRIKLYKKELNKHNPFSFGQELEGNDSYSHNGKKFVVDSTFVSSQSSSVFRVNLFDLPKFFVASGKNIKKDGSIGVQSVQRSIKMSDVISS